MCNVKFRHLTIRKNSDGTDRYYFRRRGSPIRRLPTPGTLGFEEAYEAAVADTDNILVKTPYGEGERYFTDVVMAFTDEEACLTWPYARDAGGYGKVRVGDKMHTVSRLACERANGEPPTPEHEAAHNCGKGHEGCVNPHHVRWATPKENAADKILHGTTRGRMIPPLPPVRR